MLSWHAPAPLPRGHRTSNVQSSISIVRSIGARLFDFASLHSSFLNYVQIISLTLWLHVLHLPFGIRRACFDHALRNFQGISPRPFGYIVDNSTHAYHRAATGGGFDVKISNGHLVWFVMGAWPWLARVSEYVVPQWL